MGIDDGYKIEANDVEEEFDEFASEYFLTGALVKKGQLVEKGHYHHYVA